MDGVAMEGPLPPLMKIDDDVEGVEGDTVALEFLFLLARKFADFP